MHKKYKKELLFIIRKHVPSCTVYLFGSRARSIHQSGADIDLALNAGRKIGLAPILDIKADIEETTIPLFVDVVDMHTIDKDFKEEILKDGIVWTD